MKKLSELVPEYRHKIKIIREYFIQRIEKSVEISGVKNGDKILDLGCGEAYLLKVLYSDKIKVNYIGVDINENVKDLKFDNAEFYVGDITKGLNFKDLSFDIVFAIDILEHIKDFKEVISEIYRVLVPNGVFVVCGPTESLWYKFVRFIFKGTFSSKEGPNSGEHFHNIRIIQKIILDTKKFVLKKKIYLPQFLPKIFAGVWIMKFVKL